MAVSGQEKNMRTTQHAQTIPTAHARGLTLIELMVSMAIIVIIVLAVGQIMSSAQKVVAVGQAGMRANGKVAALKSALHDDMRHISKMGCLYLDAKGHLIFNIAGPADSITTGGTSGTGAMVMYGLRDAQGGGSVLIRVGAVLDSTQPQGVTPPAQNQPPDPKFGNFDYGPYDLANFQSGIPAATTVDNWVTGWMIPIYFPSGQLPVLQQDLNLDTITNDCWKVMTTKVSAVEVFWTDGKTTHDNTTGYDNLNWYGGANGAPQTGLGTDPNVQMNTDSGNYYARWTNANPNSWPKAIKYVITMDDDSHPGTPITYEVICPVGQ